MCAKPVKLVDGYRISPLAPGMMDRLGRASGEILFGPAALRTRKGRTLEVWEYGPGCFPLLLEMYKEFQPKRVAQGLPPPDVPRIAEWLNRLQGRSRSLLAMDRKRIVGHAILCAISEAAAEYAIFVHQDFRREGLGTALTRLSIDFAGYIGFGEIVLAAELDNFAALRLFRSVGFQVTSSHGGECEMKLSIAAVQGVQSQAA